MKRQVLFVHGGNSFSNREDFLTQLRTKIPRNEYGIKSDLWPNSLRKDLGDEYDVYTPAMPNAENAQYDEWSIWFERHFEYLRDEVILVGWSLGGIFLTKYLVENKTPFSIAQLILLGSPCGSFADDSGEDCGTFLCDSESLVGLREVVSDIQIWHSEDDFVVPYAHAREFKKYLPGAKLVTFKDRNHFLQETFPELVGEIKGVG